MKPPCNSQTINKHVQTNKLTLAGIELASPGQWFAARGFSRHCSVSGICYQNQEFTPFAIRSVRLAEWVALPTSDHWVAGSNPTGGEILPELKRHFIAQSLSCSPFHCLEMTEILLKGRKTLTHPSILCY